MPDYKEMYFRLMRATEDAIRTLINAQQECEEMFLSEPGEKSIFLPSFEESEND